MYRKKRDNSALNTITGGRKTYVDKSTGETYSSWGPDTSKRARNLRKSIFK